MDVFTDSKSVSGINQDPISVVTIEINNLITLIQTNYSECKTAVSAVRLLEMVLMQLESAM